MRGSNGTWTGSPTSYRYEWLRCDPSGLSCNAIPDAADQTYSLTKADVAFSIRFRVTATNAAGSSVASSQPTLVVKNGTQDSNPQLVASAAPGSPVSFRASGAIRTHHALQWFTMRPVRRTIRVRYFDSRAMVSFRALRITRFHVYGHRLVVGGRGVVHGEEPTPPPAPLVLSSDNRSRSIRTGRSVPNSAQHRVSPSRTPGSRQYHDSMIQRAAQSPLVGLA